MIRTPIDGALNVADAIASPFVSFVFSFPSGLQPKGAKNGGTPTTDSQLGGGRSILPELKDRNKL
jgi:hypothetical protein